MKALASVAMVVGGFYLLHHSAEHWRSVLTLIEGGMALLTIIVGLYNLDGQL